MNNNDTSCGLAFGTFGELLQGQLSSGRKFLVTFPIRAFAKAFYTDDLTQDAKLKITPKSKTKALMMAELIFRHFKLPPKGHIEIVSDLPEGKGLASSSADLVAVAYALQKKYQFDLPRSLLEFFMFQIEPSDGVLYEGSVSYYYQEAMLRSFLGALPKMIIIGIDEGGIVDTIEFNKRKRNFTGEEMKAYDQLLPKMEAAIRAKNVQKISEISTRSALMQQRFKPNKFFSEILKFNHEIEGLGIVIAHSGTYIGILLNQEDPERTHKIFLAQSYLATLSHAVTVFESL